MLKHYKVPVLLIEFNPDKVRPQWSVDAAKPEVEGVQGDGGVSKVAFRVMAASSFDHACGSDWF